MTEEEDDVSDDDDYSDVPPVAEGNVLFFDGGVRRSEAGEYACVAANRHGRAAARTVLDVLCE